MLRSREGVACRLAEAAAEGGGVEQTSDSVRLRRAISFCLNNSDVAPSFRSRNRRILWDSSASSHAVVAVWASVQISAVAAPRRARHHRRRLLAQCTYPRTDFVIGITVAAGYRRVNDSSVGQRERISWGRSGPSGRYAGRLIGVVGHRRGRPGGPGALAETSWSPARMDSPARPVDERVANGYGFAIGQPE